MRLRKFNEKKWEKRLRKLTIFQLIHIETFCKAEVDYRVRMAEIRAKKKPTTKDKEE